MKKLPLAFLLFLSANILGQAPSERIDFKLYTNFGYTPKYFYNDSDSLREFETEMNGFNFSPAIVFYSESGNSSEIEISRFRFSNIYNKEYSIGSSGDSDDIISEDYKKHFELYLRYEYKIGLFKKKEWERFKPAIGFSASPYINWNKDIPGLSNTFPASRTTIGLFLSVIPRIEYQLNDKWYLDLNIPLSVLTMDFISQRTNSPLLPIEQRTNHTVELYNGPMAVAIRFGVGYMIR